MRLSLTLAAACLALSGCATPADKASDPKGVAKYKDDPRLGEKVDKLCFTSNIDSFGNNTRDTFTVREGRDYYMIEIFGSCLSLDHAMSIRLPTSSICLRNGERILVSESLTGHGPGAPFGTQSCIVNDIYKWDPKAKADTDKEKPGDDADAATESAAPAEES